MSLKGYIVQMRYPGKTPEEIIGRKVFSDEKWASIDAPDECRDCSYFDNCWKYHECWLKKFNRR